MAALCLTLLCTSVLAACGGVGGLSLPSPTGAAPPAGVTAVSVASPTPYSALPPDSLWIGVEGRGDLLLAVSRSGERAVARLPLNEGQEASNVIASRDGSSLAYMVWNIDGGQHGVAAWRLSEANARLVARPLTGYRIIAIFLADDASALAIVQVEEGKMLEVADWRVEQVSPDGGEAILLMNRETVGDIYPPMPFAWPEGGPLYLNAAMPDGQSQGVFAFDPATAQQRKLGLTDEIIVGPVLSSDGAMLAYLSVEADASGAIDGTETSHVVRVYDLILDQVSTTVPPEGRTIYGVRWHPVHRRLLLDTVAITADGQGQRPQYWALVSAGESPPWRESASGDVSPYLFDYEPFGLGVAYTAHLVDGTWRLYVLPEIGGSATPIVYTLDDITREVGDPAIIRAP